MRRNKSIITTPLWILCCVLIVLVVGCGKKGPLVPQGPKALFEWGTVQATLNEQGVMSITATFLGKVQDVDSFAIELEPVVGEICVDCPFVPREIERIQPDTMVVRGKSITYSFSHKVASTAPIFRWQLVARSVQGSFPNALTKIQTIYRDGELDHLLPIER